MRAPGLRGSCQSVDGASRKVGELQRNRCGGVDGALDHGDDATGCGRRPWAGADDDPSPLDVDTRERDEEVLDQRHGTSHVEQRTHRIGRDLRTAGEFVVGGEVRRPLLPSSARARCEANVVRWCECIPPGLDGAVWVAAGTIDRCVAVPHCSERIVVVPQPHVQPVLLDTAVGSSAARTFAPESPAPLIDGDLPDGVVGAQTPRCAQRGHAPSQDCDLSQRRGFAVAHDPSGVARRRNLDAMSTSGYWAAVATAATSSLS